MKTANRRRILRSQEGNFHTEIHRTGVEIFLRTATVQFGRLLYKQPQKVYVNIKKVKIVSPGPKMRRKKGLLKE